jgi:hypothetical protein
VGIGLPAVRQLICAYARCARLRVRCPGPYRDPTHLSHATSVSPSLVDETHNDDISWASWWDLKHPEVGGCFPAIAL